MVVIIIITHTHVISCILSAKARLYTLSLLGRCNVIHTRFHKVVYEESPFIFAVPSSCQAHKALITTKAAQHSTEPGISVPSIVGPRIMRAPLPGAVMYFNISTAEVVNWHTRQFATFNVSTIIVVEIARRNDCPGQYIAEAWVSRMKWLLPVTTVSLISSPSKA